MERKKKINYLKKQKELLEMFKTNKKKKIKELTKGYVKVKTLGKYPLAK